MLALMLAAAITLEGESSGIATFRLKATIGADGCFTAENFYGGSTHGCLKPAEHERIVAAVEALPLQPGPGRPLNLLIGGGCTNPATAYKLTYGDRVLSAQRSLRRPSSSPLFAVVRLIQGTMFPSGPRRR